MRFKRSADLIISLGILIIVVIPIVVIVIIIKFTSRGPIIYWSHRIGQNNNLFKMPKFRTMYLGSPSIASHLMDSPENYVTPVGKILRNFSLDELPQLWCVLIGEMSLIGPRPALYNQDDLIELRTENGVHLLKPGITGWAQINGRDDLSIIEKVEYDIYYLKNQSVYLDLKIFLITLKKVLMRDNVSH